MQKNKLDYFLWLEEQSKILFGEEPGELDKLNLIGLIEYEKEIQLEKLEEKLVKYLKHELQEPFTHYRGIKKRSYDIHFDTLEFEINHSVLKSRHLLKLFESKQFDICYEVAKKWVVMSKGIPEDKLLTKEELKEVINIKIPVE